MRGHMRKPTGWRAAQLGENVYGDQRCPADRQPQRELCIPQPVRVEGESRVVGQNPYEIQVYQHTGASAARPPASHLQMMGQVGVVEVPLGNGESQLASCDGDPSLELIDGYSNSSR